MFSSTLSDAALQAIYAPLAGLPTLLLLSGAEEYLPPGLDYRAVGRRLAQAIGPSAVVETMEGAPHNMGGKEEEGARLIADFVASL